MVLEVRDGLHGGSASPSFSISRRIALRVRRALVFISCLLRGDDAADQIVEGAALASVQEVSLTGWPILPQFCRLAPRGQLELTKRER
ncbi:hypothetical protein BFG51_11455 [Dietzia alimentaria]|nr:hypothetical protein BFG51_11455 [Dietzia alimentaria]